MTAVVENLISIRGKINTALQRDGREPSSVKLVAVSKTKPASLIKEAYDAGQRVFGENYVQELIAKQEGLCGLDIEWHFVGHLQRNKVRHIVPFIRCIHSLDSIKLAKEIEKRAPGPIDCLIEVNVAGESSKTGISPDDVDGLIEAVREMKKISLKGLMTIPPLGDEPENSRPYFKRLSALLNDINKRGIYPERLTELSMGMTGDLEVAIEEGATMVRVGTAIFGERRVD